MKAAIVRALGLCRPLHRGDHLRPALVGGGALQCSRCGSKFRDLADALGLPEHEAFVSVDALLRYQGARTGGVDFVAREFRVIETRTGQVVRTGRFGSAA